MTQTSVSLLAVLLIVKTWENKPLSSIGFTGLKLSDALLGVFGWYASALLKYHFILWDLGRSTHVGSAAASPSPALPLLAAPLGLRIALSIVVGVAEEVGCRGFTVERLAGALGSVWAAGACAFALSMAAHIPFWGTTNLLFLAPSQFIFTALYCWRRNLTSPVAAHILSDSYGMWISQFLRVRIYY